MATKKKVPVARKVAARAPKKETAKKALAKKAPSKRQLYLNMKLSEIEAIRSIGHGSFTEGLRELVKLDVPDTPLADVFLHRTSARMSNEDIRRFLEIGNGSVTNGIRRAMQYKLDDMARSAEDAVA